MYEYRKQLADSLRASHKSLDPQRWLAEEAAELGLKIHGLDDIPTHSVHALGYLYANGPASTDTLLQSTDIDAEKIEDYLDSLTHYGLIRQCVNGFELTDKGDKAFTEIAKKMILRMHFELTRELDFVNRLRREMDKLS